MVEVKGRITSSLDKTVWHIKEGIIHNKLKWIYKNENGYIKIMSFYF